MAFNFVGNLKTWFRDTFHEIHVSTGEAGGWVHATRGRCTCTSGSRVCCSSFCFRDVQGLNGFNSLVCMSLPIPSINRLLLPPNEGNAQS